MRKTRHLQKRTPPDNHTIHPFAEPVIGRVVTDSGHGTDNNNVYIVPRNHNILTCMSNSISSSSRGRSKRPSCALSALVLCFLFTSQVDS